MTAGRIFRHLLRYAGGCVVSFGFWTLWLLLGALAAVQFYVAFRSELTVPAFVLRRIEERVAQNGLKVTFADATFDPTGRMLLREPQVFLAGFSDPVLSARAAYIGVNPWPLFVGRIEPSEIRIAGGTVSVPAILSPSGQAEAIVRDVDADVEPADSQLVIRHVTARFGALVVSVHGAAIVPPRSARPPGQMNDLLRARFKEFCQAAVQLTRRLEAFEEPSADLELAPSPTRGAIVTAQIAARGVKLDTPFAMELGRFRATTRFPLLGDTPAMSHLDFSAAELHLPGAVEIRELSAELRGRLRPTELRVDPVELRIAAAAVVTPDGTADDFSGVLRPEPLPKVRGELVARVLGAPVDVSGTADLSARTAHLTVNGSVSPAIVGALQPRVRVDLGKFFGFASADLSDSTVELGPNWHFQRAVAHVALQQIRAHGVLMDEGRATIEVDPTHLYAPEAYARIGENYARGTYEHEFATRRFRFLLDGRLRPMDIDPWFRGWWTNFFQRFEFPKAPPNASVDVQGTWGQGWKTSVFVFVDSDAPVALGQSLRRLRGRLFVRPGFYDGLELHAVDPDGGAADGTFTVTASVSRKLWRTIDVDLKSNVSLAAAGRMAGELGRAVLGPFELSAAPALKLHAHFDGPAVAPPRHRSLDLEARTTGSFKFHDFPLQDVAFTAALRDDELTIDNLIAKFAGGVARGHAKLWGTGANQRLGFDASINDASLGQAVAALQDFSAERKNQPRPAPGKFVQAKSNVRLDLAASAEGLYSNPLSYHGDGNASLRGAEIGEVPLLGLLSELLKFTALRFTTARASFKINGTKLDFSEVALRGANSAIDAHGNYALDRRQLDFRAKVFPFQESDSVIKSVVGAVLSPISNVLEVKLTGTLEKPDWAFVIGPTNLLRSLAPTPSPPAGHEPPPPTPAGSAAPTSTGAPVPGAPGKPAAAPVTAPPGTNSSSGEKTAVPADAGHATAGRH
ncbi:MAG TPA: AsmA-like C-terminal region-containing protein [Opitutaceae bacterium]|nr:AsmA-like C-terminal region-containing protein [Opitutaceae bacterium]